MDNEMIATIVILIIVVIMVLGLILVGEAKDNYEDTIDEYMMCIEYNPDCECSDIILSEYGEEK